jgi:ferritin-like metal-binding protein YciE
METREKNQKLEAMKRPRNRNTGVLLRTYIRQVQELYDFETQFLALLLQFRAAALSEELQGLFAQHAQHTLEHVAGLEEIMKRLIVPPHGVHFRKTSHLLTNLRRFLSGPSNRQDNRHETAILSALHKVEAFEVACYAATHSYARLLSFHDNLATLEKAYGEAKAMEERIENLVHQHNPSEAAEFQLTV